MSSTPHRTGIKKPDARQSFPHHYDEPYLYALVKNPHWIFLFWETTDERMQLAYATLGCTGVEGVTRRVLRLMDITDINFNGANAWRTYDTAIDAVADNWYLKVPEPGRDYLVELGLLHLDGRFAPVLTSNMVSTPAGCASTEFGDEWTDTRSFKLFSQALDDIARGDGSSPGAIRPVSGEKGLAHGT
jgi:uncharacterized protein